MHLMRENMLKLLDVKLCIVRPTLIYGTNDPHNGYGPNQFIRLAQSKKKQSEKASNSQCKWQDILLVRSLKVLNPNRSIKPTRS